MATSTRQDSRDHHFAAENLSAYLDGEMSARDDTRVKAHLARCQSCRQDAATLRMTSQLLRQAPRQPLPRSFALSPSAVAEQKSYRRWSLAQSWLRTASAIVSVMLVVLLSGDVILSQGWLSPLSMTAAPQYEMLAEDTAMEPVIEPAAEAQLETQSVELAPKAGAGEPEQPLAAQAVSISKQSLPEAQPEIARVMAEPQDTTQDALAQALAQAPVQEPVSGSSAAQAPLVRPMPKSASAPAPGVGGGGATSQNDVAAIPPEPEAASQSQAVMLEPTHEEASIKRAVVPDQEVTGVVAGKIGLPTSAPVQERVILMAEPEPEQPLAQAKEPLLRGAETSADQYPVTPRDNYTRIWRTLRIASLLTLGLLMMLVAGLLVALQKRRI